MIFCPQCDDSQLCPGCGHDPMLDHVPVERRVRERDWLDVWTDHARTRFRIARRVDDLVLEGVL